MDLFEKVMNDRWDDVVKTYEEDISAQEKKITASEETSLHMAVQFGKTAIVKQLVDKIADDNASQVLNKKNKNGDTALHLAAALGDVAMCSWIAKKDPTRTIITNTNCKGETPLFLAALYGKQKAFLCLHFLYQERFESLDSSVCIRANGDTILHSAIFREHFGLALQIIDFYPYLVNRVDNNGFSPLHILASKPNAFATSCPLGPGECLIYICIKVFRLVKDDLLQAVVVKSYKRVENRQNSYNRGDEENPQPAEGTHIALSAEIERLRDGENSQPAKGKFITSSAEIERLRDGENSQPAQGTYITSSAETERLRDGENPQPAQECGTRLKNLVAAMVSLVYTAIASILSLALHLVRVATFGLLDIKLLISRGIWKINRVNETEKRHKLAVNLLDKLVSKYSSVYKYENAGNLQNANRENAGNAHADNSQNGNGENADNVQNANGENAGDTQNPGNPQNANGENRCTAHVANGENAANAQNANGENAGDTQNPGNPQNANGENRCTAHVANGENAANAQNANGENAEDAQNPDNPQNANEANVGHAHNANGENAANAQIANGENTENVQNLGNPQNANGGNVGTLAKDDDKKNKETPILIAARMGVTEVVKKILNKFPLASFDLDSDHKNVVLLAAENKQTEVYKLLMKKKQLKERMFAQLDCEGNSALQLAATFKENLLRNFPEAATQMRWELEWYQFVKRSMPPYFFTLHNKKGMTPEEVFTNEHKELVKRGSEWLMKTSESCSVVAALIATVAFATSATVPGGNKENKGSPNFEGLTMFSIFSISSLLALCLSVTALVYFLAIRTSGFKEKDFAGDLPKKLFVGLGALSASLASILVSFCSGHFLMLDHSLKAISKPIYVFTIFTVILLFAFHLPFYYRLLVFNF